MSGGVAFYFSYAINCLPRAVDYTLLTKLATEDQPAVDAMREAGINVLQRPSATTVFFENIYGDNPDDRKQRVRAKSEPFGVGDVFTLGPASTSELVLAPELAGVSIVHLGTLLADDFSMELVQRLREVGATISADAQGFLREVVGESVHKCDWANKAQWLSMIDIIKVNEMEAEVLTGESDPQRAAEIIASYGPREVLVTLGSLGSLLLVDGELIRVGAYAPTAVVDATGCGDTYMAGYLYCRAQGQAPSDAARFAAAMCTSKLSHNGPFNGTLEELRTILSR